MEFQDMKRQLRKTDPYEILGVKPFDDPSTIKNTFKKMALKYHPDKNTTKGAKEAFTNISNAYEVLTKPKDYSAPKETSFRPPESANARQYNSKNASSTTFNSNKPSYTHKGSFQQRKPTNFPNQAQKEFQEKIFKTFEKVHNKFKTNTQPRTSSHTHAFDPATQNRRNFTFGNNQRRNNPPPILLLLAVLFLMVFFSKINTPGGISSFRGMPTSFMMRSMSRFQRRPRRRMNSPRMGTSTPASPPLQSPSHVQTVTQADAPSQMPSKQKPNKKQQGKKKGKKTN